jgi:hypothetical protein
MLQVRDRVHTIARIVPEGWSAHCDGQRLVVSRDQTVEFYNTVNLPANTGIDELRREGFVHKTSYAVTLRFGDRIAPETYRRLAARDSAISEQMATMQDQMRHIPHKFDAYLPNTPEDKQLVKAYNRLKASLHDLPDYFDEKHSIWVSDSLGWACAFASEEVGDECTAVRNKVLAQFHSYETAP